MNDLPSHDDPSNGSVLLAELADDFAARYRRGERPDLDEFARQHPALASEIRELFPAMVAMEDAGAGVASAAPTRAPEAAGSVVGRYKLLERLGEGGFGVVYMAEQRHPVRRKVALKLIRPGLDTHQVIARFEAERQALAMMDHENIARVLDAGATDSGRPYFVMELVHGVPITDYCETNRLAPRQRLELFVRVCRAIQHAHTKGIIHRDLKPTNVLVAVHDGLAVPKVIDFGVAKATGRQQLTDGTLFTQFVQMVGTPLYMSPEQAEMSGLDVDTRSDVYSLGVLLYELLTGTTPLDRERLKQAALDEVRRIIREEEPPRPSTRISTLSGRLPEASAERRGELNKLGQLVRGELDWIVMKALEKDRARRYETAGGLAADVERYLNDEAVHACPPSTTYRVRKLLRRHRGPFAAAALVALALVGGIVGTTWGMVRATRAQSRERDQLFRTLLSQAGFERGGGRVGQRFGTLKTLARAAQIHVTPELRAEAAAALALPDVELAQEWDDTGPLDRLAMSFDGPAIRYARVTERGEVTIYRVIGGREEVVTQLPAYGNRMIRGPWLSPDGRFVAYGHSGTHAESAAALRVWKLAGRGPEVLLDDPAGVSVSAVAFHGGGHWLAVGHAAGGLSVYDVESADRVRTFPVGVVTALAFHPTDQRVAVVYDNIVRVLDSATGRELATLRPPGSVKPTAIVRCMAWHPDGRHLAIGCYDGRIYLFDADSAAEVMPAWVGRRQFEMIAFNHSGDRLISSESTGEARLWDVATGTALLTLPSNLSSGSAFSPDDGLVGFSRAGGKIRVWRVACGRELRVLGRRDVGPGGLVGGRVVDPSGRVLAGAAPDRLYFYDVKTGEELASALRPNDASWPFAFDAGGGWLTCGLHGVMLWPLRSEPGQPESLRVGPPQLIVSSNGVEISGGSGTGPWYAGGTHGVMVWPARSDGAAPDASPAGAPPSPASGLGALDWLYSSANSDGKVLAIPDSNSTLLIHRDGSNSHLSLGPEFDVKSASVSADGQWVISCSGGAGGSSTGIRVWNGRTGQPVRDLPRTAGSRGHFSPNGRWLGTSDGSDSRLWRTDTWEEARPPFAGMFIFSPDSKLMAVNDVLGCLRLVMTETGKEVARVTGPRPVSYMPMCFTPDGTRLIASNETLHVWDLRFIRDQLRAMGLDWDWPPFLPEVPDPRRRLRLTLDTGDSVPRGPGAPFPGPQEPTPELDRPK